MKKKTPIGLGFIGCGGHSGRHADVLSRLPGEFEIVAALDSDVVRADDFLNAHNAPNAPPFVFLENYPTSPFSQGNRAEAVLIGTPHKYHLDYCRMALEAGKHILCEKPLWEGDHAEEGNRIIAETLDRGLVFSSCHPRRFEKEYLFVKKHLPRYTKRFGKAVEVRFQFFYHKPSTGWKTDDSLLLDHMNHEIDLVHFLFGRSNEKFWRVSQGFDEYRVAGRTENGLGIWFTGYRRLESRTFRNELEIVFERGRVRVEVVLDSSSGQVASRVIEQSFEDDSEIVTRFAPHSYDDSLVGVMKNFAAAIRGEEPCYLSLQDMVTNTTICNALLADEYAEIVV